MKYIQFYYSKIPFVLVYEKTPCFLSQIILFI